MYMVYNYYNFLYQLFNKHCVKRALIQSYSGPYFAAFALNTKRYSVSLRIKSECGKIRIRITLNTDTFHYFYQFQSGCRNTFKSKFRETKQEITAGILSIQILAAWILTNKLRPRRFSRVSARFPLSTDPLSYLSLRTVSHKCFSLFTEAYVYLQISLFTEEPGFFGKQLMNSQCFYHTV